MVISSDMQEILGLLGRIVALYLGRIVGEFPSRGLAEEVLVQAIMGRVFAGGCQADSLGICCFRRRGLPATAHPDHPPAARA